MHGHYESVVRSHLWRTAHNSADLAKLVPERHIIGIERSAEDVLQAAAQGISNITYAVDDVPAPPPSPIIHLTSCKSSVLSTLEHVSDPVLALPKERHRVAKPGTIWDANPSRSFAYPSRLSPKSCFSD
ncbi:hypothetical protein B0H14DRAFT_3736565 [Mycena olivaceomarginata]|nr:hypothetical protein B0H14DRAFT_3736565 [Mycena olivaceomarginata]